VSTIFKKKYIYISTDCRTRNGWVQWQLPRLVFGRCKIRIFSDTLTILTEDFRDFHNFVAENGWLVPRVGLNRFLPDSFQLNSHLSPYHSMLCNLWILTASVSNRQPLRRISVAKLLVYCPYFEKIKVSLWDHLALCVSVSPPPKSTYECLNQSLWNLVCVSATWAHLNGVLHKSVCVSVSPL
jgi:hypothetical protein